MIRTLWLNLAAVFAFLWLANPLRAQYVYVTPPSPEANGRAGIYTSSESDDPLAAMSNPALPGLQAERNRLMVGFYPERTHWNQSNYYGYGYSARALQFGLDSQTLQRFFHWKLPLSLGLGYHEAYWDMRATGSSDGFHYTEHSRMTNLSAALHYRCLQAGVGLNYRFSDIGESDSYWSGAYLFGHPTSVDVGLYLQSPLDRLIYREEHDSSGKMPLRPFCTVGYSYVLANDGNAMKENNSYGYAAYSYPLPRAAKMGVNVSGGLRAPHPIQDSWKIVSVETGIEAIDYLPRFPHDTGYQNPIGNIHPVSTLLLGKADIGVVLRKGFEVGLGEAVYYRWGNITGDTYEPMTSDGFGIHLSGLLKSLTWNILPDSRILNFTARHLDVQYEQCKQKWEANPYYKNGVTSRQLTLLWKY